MGEDKGLVLLESVREQCLKKGLGGIKGLGVLFRGLDKDFSQSLCYEEFHHGMKSYGIHMSDGDFRILFKFFDKDKSGTISFREFLTELRPPMAKSRIDVIGQAFDKLDVIRDHLLKSDDLKLCYKENAMKHPKYASGEWTLDEVLAHFIDTFDSPDDKDGMVTLDEFINYYAGVSMTIADDAYFDLMMRSCWALPNRAS